MITGGEPCKFLVCVSTEDVNPVGRMTYQEEGVECPSCRLRVESARVGVGGGLDPLLLFALILWPVFAQVYLVGQIYAGDRSYGLEMRVVGKCEQVIFCRLSEGLGNKGPGVAGYP